ncbi:MAG: hypothetical protein H6739_40540 [Alphaproteobacteria bacterium]|nr:hypothetical protein [Alphaproteobacteria bacterium]
MRTLLISAALLSACGEKTPPTVAADPEAAPAEDALPEPLALLQGYEAALANGDLARAEAVTSTYTAMKMEMPSQGITAPIESWWAAPDKTLIRMTLEGLGESVQGYDGEVGWSVDPMMGPRVMSEAEVAQQALLRQLTEDPSVVAGMAEVTGREDFEGMDTWAMTVEPPDGAAPLHLWFDVESGLLMGMVNKVETPMGAMETRTVNAAYTEYDGLLVPSRIVQTALGMEQVLTVESVTWNPETLPDFGPPEAVQALLDEAAGGN